MTSQQHRGGRSALIDNPAQDAPTVRTKKSPRLAVHVTGKIGSKKMEGWMRGAGQGHWNISISEDACVAPEPWIHNLGPTTRPRRMGARELESMARKWTDDLNSVTRLWILPLPISHPDVADAFCCKPQATGPNQTPHSSPDAARCQYHQLRCVCDDQLKCLIIVVLSDAD